MNNITPQLAIVYPGDATVRAAATRENNRFAALFEAFAAAGVAAHPVVYNDDQVAEARAQLLAVDGALVWVNPIEAGRSRATLDALLREVAAAGVMVSTHPDTILKLGTKDVLVATRHLAFGSDCHHVASLARLRAELPARLAGGATRVLKQWRGHSGIGVWQVRGPADGSSPSEHTPLFVRHAQRGSLPETLTLAEFMQRMAVYFEAGGHMVDQPWQPRLNEGMLRCYVVNKQVAGFGVQAVNALYPAPEGAAPEAAPPPGPRLYHGPDLPLGQALKQQLEGRWIAELQAALAIPDEQLPLLWDCDFLLGERGADAQPGDPERYVLCEINVSSVAPYPESAIVPLVQATRARLAARAAR